MLLPFVKWDRFYENKEGIGLFGWIDREDTYKDFVFISYDYDSKESKKRHQHTWIMEWATSSVIYSKKIDTLLNDYDGSEHADCQRVESIFDIPNCIKLKTTTEILPNTK